LYARERQELANFIKENDITNLLMISGDAHMLAIDDGSNSDYADGGGAPFPVFHAASLDRTPGIKGGPYSHGAYPGVGQFGLVEVSDWGDSIGATLVGLNYRYDDVIRYSFALPVRLEPNAIAVAEPETLYEVYSRRLYPLQMPFYVGSFAEGRKVFDLDLNSLTLNGKLSFDTLTILDSHPEFEGATLRATASQRDFVRPYIPLWDTTARSYEITGRFNDGSPFLASGTVVFIGHRSGDINGDGALNLLDLTLLVDIVFRGADWIVNVEYADLDGDGIIGILDVSRAVNLLYQ